MEDVQLFVMDIAANNPEIDQRASLNNNYELPSSTSFYSENCEEPCYEDVEVELLKKEKELFLCSELGLCLAQEIDELLAQQKNLVHDHTRVLLDLQSYEKSKNSFLDLRESPTEFNDTIGSISSSLMSPVSSEIQIFNPMSHGANGGLDHWDKLEHLQSQIFSFGSGKTAELSHIPTTIRTMMHSPDRLEELHGIQGGYAHTRSGSMDSLTEILSLPESTMTAFSNVTKNLQSDLDRLQRAHDRITKLELQLDSSRARHRKLLNEFSRKLKETSQGLGSCVEKARPYFVTVQKARKVQVETQQAAMQYKRAVNLQKAGRDMVRVAEERLSSASDKFDVTWQEMLNQATQKVNEASREKDRIHKIHLKAARDFECAEEEKNKLQITLQRSIVRAKPYFEIQEDFRSKLESTTKRLNTLEVKLLEARQTYSAALSSIRKSGDGDGSSVALDSLAERGIGVGAENPYGDGSILPKPMQDILRMEAAAKATNNQVTTKVVKTDSVEKKSRFQYNPYDLMYLKDTESETGSVPGSTGDDYIQDF